MAPPPLWVIDQELFRLVHLELRRPWLDPVVHVANMSGLGYLQILALALAGLRHRTGPWGELGAALILAVGCALIERNPSAGLAFLGVWLIVRQFQPRECWWAVGAVALSGLVRLAIVPGVARERPSNFDFAQPFEPIFGRSSMPSGHATTTFALFFMLAWLAGPRWPAALAGSWAVLVGFSRVYGGVHYPLDVVAGAALGLTTASILAALDRHLTAAREASSNRPALRNLS